MTRRVWAKVTHLCGMLSRVFKPKERVYEL